MIMRDASDLLATCLRSARPLCDELIVVDTDSQDNSVEIAQSFGAKVIPFRRADHPHDFMDIPDENGTAHECLANFALARNISFNAASGDQILWLDHDDELRGLEHWPEMLRRFEEQKLDAVLLPYNYAQDDRGRCIHRLWRERLVRNDPKWRWEGVVHEVLSPYGRNIAMYEPVEVFHHKGRRKRPILKRRNLEILLAKGDRSQSRTLFYLGTEHTYNGEYKEAVEAFRKYLPLAHEPDELYQALYYLGDLYRVGGNFEAAIEHYQKAMVLRPNWRDAYFGLGACFGHMRDWDRCLYYIRQGRQQPEAPATLFAVNPKHERLGWVEWCVTALREKGEDKQALDTLLPALREEPDHPVYRQLHGDLVRRINEHTGRTALCDSIEHLLRQDRLGDAVSVARMLDDTTDEEAWRLAETTIRHGESAQRLELPGRTFRAPPGQSVTFSDDRVGWIMNALANNMAIRRLAVPGCGDAYLLRFVGLYARLDVEAWDPDPLAVGAANARREWQPWPFDVAAERRPLLSAPRVVPDAVLLMGVLEHTPESTHEGIIAECLSWLPPGGILLIIVPKGPGDPDGAGPRAGNIRAAAFLPDQLRRVALTHRIPEEIPSAGRPWLGLAVRKPITAQIPPRRIAFVCPPALEPWGPASLGQGIGGSEESIVRLSRELARRGHRVTVYGDWQGDDPVDGHAVRYRHPRHYTRPDICVSWRVPEVFHRRRLPEAEWLWLWLHDTIEPERLKPVLPHLDALLVGSHFQASLYPEAVESLRIVRYGIAPEEFPEIEERRPDRFVWTMCPTRGLETLLDHWPAIRRALPEAELRVFYGFGNVDRMAAMQPGTEGVRKLLEVKARILQKREQPGVVWRGRVGHAEIAREMLGAGIFGYPTNFPEIMCHPPDTPVATERGLVPIQQVTCDDKVLTHRGRFRQVTRIMRREYVGDLITIMAQNSEPISLTPEHPVLACPTKYWRQKTKQEGEWDWVEAHSLRDCHWGRSGHLLFVPRLKPGGAREWQIPRDWTLLRDSNLPTKRKPLAPAITLDAQMCRWLGWFLGDGSANPIRSQVSVCLGPRDTGEISLIEHGFRQFGVEPGLRTGRRWTTVKAESLPLARFLASRCYTPDRKKRLPAVAFDMDLDQRRALIEGLIAADGSVGAGWRGMRIHRLTSSSLPLIGGVRMLLNSLGIASRIRTRDHRNGLISYDMEFQWQAQGGRDQRFFSTWDDHLSVKVRRVEHRPYAGPVFNLEVAEDQSYTVGQWVVHNCISGVKAMAAGCWPVFYPVACLPETIAWGWPSTEADFVANCIKAATGGKPEPERQRMRRWAKACFSWENVALSWERLMCEG